MVADEDDEAFAGALQMTRTALPRRETSRIPGSSSVTCGASDHRLEFYRAYRESPREMGGVLFSVLLFVNEARVEGYGNQRIIRSES